MDHLTIREAHKAFKANQFTSRELVEHYYRRISLYDRKGPALNSILAIPADSALERAQELDKHLQRTGNFVGALHGIPVLIKDQAETEGVVTTYGSKVFNGNVPDTDATLVQRLKDAGAIIIAKTTLPDWATSFNSASSVSGVTKNPFDLSRDPGGSSSGTAAAIAADFAILGLGEDTGGSIRLPASFCGLVGIRCTPGLVSRAGLAPLVVPQDTPGPMTRRVRDAALMLDVIVGFDEKDPYTTAAVVAGKPRGGSYAAHLDPKAIRRARLGILRSVFGSDSNPDYKEVNRVIQLATDILKKNGTTAIDIEIPRLDELIATSSLYDIRSRSDLDRFLAIKRPGLTCHQILIERQYHPSCDLFEDLARGPEDPTRDLRYAARIEAQLEFQRVIMQTIETHKLDAIVFPDAKIAAPLTSDVLEGRWPALRFPINTLIASQARLPAVTVPVGLTEGGLPVGLELMGLLYREQCLLELAHGIEDLMKFNAVPNLEGKSQEEFEGESKGDWTKNLSKHWWGHWWKSWGRNQRKNR
ncbi:hypothetical protein HFD88_008996 [Aspergillus terreus]|nr:hypothetical protein HFD88_008996 [Aspergillus terreus]